MKRVRLITTDEHNGKEAISRTPLRNRYFFAGAWHEVKLKTEKADENLNAEVIIKPGILRDAQIIETVEAVYAELTDTFDIMALIQHVECEMPTKKHEATIQRQLCQLRQYGKLNYEVVDEKKGLYRKLPVVSKTCAEQVKMDFQPDWKKRFVEFLKEEGAYDLYIANFTVFKTIKEVYDYAKKQDNIGSLVVYGFDWEKTIQGATYWINLSKKWRAIYNGKN